jgi:serine/threonine-protein kinase HipA
MLIYVYKQNKYLGKLEENNTNISFTYNKNINKDHYIIGIENVTNEFDDLPLVFKNLLLENSDLTNIKTSTKIEKLLFLNNIHGSYKFSKDKLNLPSKNKIYKYQNIKAEILENNYIFPNILDYKINISAEKLKTNNENNIQGLSGFQHKFSIIKDDQNKTIEHTTINNSNYFMKPYNEYHLNFNQNSYIPCLLINEHLFMTIARDLGFSVPYNAIIKGENDYHYIIKRFDRFKDIEFDHEEFATMLGFDTNTKYDATIIEILNKAQQYLSKTKIKEILSFIFYSVVISHGDLHSKNLSLIHQSNKPNEQQKDLSPYYDISTTAIYKLEKNDIGMRIYNKKRNIKKQDFLKLAEKFEINDFENEIIRISRYFIDNFQKYINKLPDDIKNIPITQSKYNTKKSFKFILEKYYKQRCKYIKAKIDINLLPDDNIFL